MQVLFQGITHLPGRVSNNGSGQIIRPWYFFIDTTDTKSTSGVSTKTGHNNGCSGRLDSLGQQVTQGDLA